MSLEVTQRPPGWVWAFSPIIYKLQRKDYPSSTVDSNGGLIRVTIFAGTDYTALFVAGDLCYLKTDAGIYNLNVTVSSSAYSGGHTKVTFTQAWTANDTTGFINTFTRRPGYRVEVYLPRWANPRIDSPRIDDPLIYTPDKKGSLTVDIQIVQSLLNETIAQVPASNALYDDAANHYMQRWIAYREVWVGSAEAIVDDSAEDGGNVAWGAGQVGLTTLNAGVNDMDLFILNGPTKKFLTLLDSMTMMEGQKFNISVLTDRIDAALYVSRLNNTSPVGFDIIDFTGMANKIVRVGLAKTLTEDQLQIVLGQGFFLKAPNAGGIWTDVDAFTSKSATQFIRNVATGTANPEADSYMLMAPPVGVNLKVKFTVTITGTFTSGFISVFFYTALAAGPATSTHQYNILPNFTANGVYTIEEIITVQDPSTARLYVTMSKTSFVGAVTVAITPTLGAIGINNVVPYSEIKTINILPPRPSIVNVMWWNFLGGIENWVFSLNQGVGFNKRDIKARVLTLYADNLSMNEWETIDGMMTLGEVYRPSMIELTTAKKGTSKRIGQQVIVVDSAGNIMEVTALSIDNSATTITPKQYAQFQIELPSVQLP